MSRLNSTILMTLTSCLVTACTLDEPTDDVATTSAAVCDYVNNDDCVPDYDELAPAPSTVTYTNRTTSSLSFSYHAKADWTSHEIQRRQADGSTWTTIKTYSAVPNGTRAYTSSSLWSDLGYCFRIRATNANGTGYGPGPCAVTRSSGQPNPTVKRLQLRVKIADVSGAGTDDPVEVWLGTYDLPGDNRTGLNYAPVPVKDPAGVTWHDDFARNRERTFDLVTTNIATLRDISRIQIKKRAKFGESGGGTNGMCIESFALLVNGATAYSRNFGSSTCRWIDNAPGMSPSFTVSFDDLRQASSFDDFVDPPIVFDPAPNADGMPTFTIQAAELKSRIEGIVGDAVWNRGKIATTPWGTSSTVMVDWDYTANAVELAKPWLSNRVHVDLDLEMRASGQPDAFIDADFDLVPSFENTSTGYSLRLDVENFDTEADLPAWADVAIWSFCRVWNSFGDDCSIAEVEAGIEAKIEASFGFEQRPIPFATTAELAALGCTEPTVTVTAGAALQFSCR